MCIAVSKLQRRIPTYLVNPYSKSKIKTKEGVTSIQKKQQKDQNNVIYTTFVVLKYTSKRFRIFGGMNVLSIIYSFFYCVTYKL